MRALVIDDSRAMRSIIARTLRELGFEVAEAVHGRDALAQLGSGAPPPELMLVDWNMPEMNGFEYLTAVRAEPAYDGARVMMVTTESELPHMRRALDAGADEYLLKPFTKDALVDKIRLLGMAPAARQ